MPNLLHLPLWSGEGIANVVIETPRGARGKFTFDPKLRVFTYSKPMMAGLTYPTDWGFLPSTLAPDGDAVDALVIHDIETFPGLVLECRIIGVLKTREDNGRKALRNDRVIAVPVEAHRERQLADVDSMPVELKEEFERFFAATNALKDKSQEFLGWDGRKQAMKLIKRAAKRFKRRNTG